MKILALDAALGPFSAALDLDGQLTTDRSDRNDALEAGLERIARLLTAAGVGLGDLDRIAVGTGPGAFTGLRIALSFAKALAYGSSVPLVGISSYDALLPEDAAAPTLAIVSGRPGFICARLRRAPEATGGPSTAAPAVCGAIATVLDELAGALAQPGEITLATLAQDAAAAICARGIPVVRRMSCADVNPALAIARLARTREPARSPHSVAPDYGEMPAVTVPKAGTEIAP